MPSSTSLSVFNTANTTIADSIEGILTTGNVLLALVVVGAIALLYRWIRYATHKATRP